MGQQYASIFNISTLRISNKVGAKKRHHYKSRKIDHKIIMLEKEQESMSFVDFGINVLAGWLANKLDRFNFIFFNEEENTDLSKEQRNFHDVASECPKLFRTFDVFRDLEKMLSFIECPVAHIIIEKEPSSFWNLACLVIESKVTGEWYVFERGRMAVQGTGGGIRQSEICLKLLRENKVYIAAWTASKVLLDEFEKGYKLWPEIKLSAIPLCASINVQKDWHLIIEKTKELLSSF